MFSDCMMTWLTPTISGSRAEGTSTRHVIWRGVQPTMRPRSCTSSGTRCRARVVIRVIGGMAKIRVATMAEVGPKPKRIRIGTR